MELFSNHNKAELVWQLTYAAQLTQDRREVDALQTEFVLAFGYALAGMLAIPLVVINRAVLSPEVIGILVGTVAVAIAAAVGYGLRCRRKKTAHLISLLVQYFSWGDAMNVDDREA